MPEQGFHRLKPHSPDVLGPALQGAGAHGSPIQHRRHHKWMGFEKLKHQFLSLNTLNSHESSFNLLSTCGSFNYVVFIRSPVTDFKF